nr:MAG TPA: hypothetical protein [Caudoviricetes sp.]
MFDFRVKVKRLTIFYRDAGFLQRSSCNLLTAAVF